MKILNVVIALNTGGLEGVVLDLLKFGAAWNQNHLCCLDVIGDHKATVDDLRIPYIELNYGLAAKVVTLARLIRYIRENDIDIIHTHNPSPHFYGSVAGFICRVPVVNTKHGDNTKNRFNHMWLNRFSSLISKVNVCVSQDSYNIAKNKERIPVRKLTTIINGIDIRKYAGVRRRPDGRDRRIGIVARISVEKDHSTLLRAFAMISKEMPDVGLVVVGDGPLLNEIKGMAADLDIDSQVAFLGNRKDVPEILSCLDLFVLSSVSEGLPLTLLEAMAAGLPVVCTDTGGNAEVVAHGRTGFVVPVSDPCAMADRIKRLMSDPSLAKSMGEEGHARVAERFDVSLTVKKYEALYEEYVN